MKEQCLCLYGSRKDDEVAVPVCAQEHERYCLAPPHRTPTGSNDESAVTMSRMRDDEGAQVSDILLTGRASE